MDIADQLQRRPNRLSKKLPPDELLATGCTRASWLPIAPGGRGAADDGTGAVATRCGCACGCGGSMWPYCGCAAAGTRGCGGEATREAGAGARGASASDAGGSGADTT